MPHSSDRNKLITAFIENMQAFGTLMHSSRVENDAKADVMPTKAQLGIMYAVSHEGIQSVKELALRFRISSSGVTQVIDGLVREGLMIRTEDAKDRRKTSISLTKKGFAAFERGKKSRFALLQKMLESLSDSEIATMNAIQKKLLENLNSKHEKKS
jgi:MarR family transcriptional regulator for hemolysin